jgi:hypothetical protein
LGAAEGVLSSNLCRIVQDRSGADCCNLDPIAPPIVEKKQDVCVAALGPCDATDPNIPPCCPGLECRVRGSVTGGQQLCSAVNKNPKDRITSDDRNGIGGADRSSRNGVRGGA